MKGHHLKAWLSMLEEEVPATGLEHFVFTQSGYGSLTPERASRIREYCNVTGYVAPQNKFVLKLPLPRRNNRPVAACSISAAQLTDRVARRAEQIRNEWNAREAENGASR
jgi:hypothetical protein